jgi:hypothetical protein
MRFISVLVAGALSPLYEEAKTSASAANKGQAKFKRRRKNLTVRKYKDSVNIRPLITIGK